MKAGNEHTRSDVHHTGDILALLRYPKFTQVLKAYGAGSHAVVPLTSGLQVKHIFGIDMDDTHFWEYAKEIVTLEVTIHLTMTIAAFILIAVVGVKFAFVPGTAKVL